MGTLSSKHQIVPFSENSYYIGPTNKKDELNGKGKYVDEFGNCYVGRFKNSNFNGYGIMDYNNYSCTSESEILPTYYEGNWKDNSKHGKGKIQYNNESKYVGSFKFDELHGKGKYTFPDGMYYIGKMKLGTITGYGTLYTADKKPVYKGYWLNNSYNGKGTYYEDGEIYYKGKWTSGYCHGVGVIYDENGKKDYKAIFNKGDIDKIIKNYYYVKPKASNKVTKFPSIRQTDPNKATKIPTIRSTIRPTLDIKSIVNPAHKLNTVQKHKITTPKSVKLNSDDFKKVNTNRTLFTKRNPRTLKNISKMPPIISVNPCFNI